MIVVGSTDGSLSAYAVAAEGEDLPTPPPTATPEPTPTPNTETSYLSPTYGWRLTWDPAVWRVYAETSDDEGDFLDLVNEMSDVQFLAGPFYSGDADLC